MAEKKMTRIEALNIAIAAVDNAEAVEVLTKMAAQISKPRRNAGEPTKARRDNERFAHLFADVIKAHGERVTGKYLAEHVSGLPSTSPQKVAAIAAVGIELGLFTKTKEGKTIYYEIA